MLTLSIHSGYKYQNRGFHSDLYDFLTRFGEWEFVKGAHQVHIPKRKLEELLFDKSISIELKRFIRQNFERIIKKALIVNNGVIITCINITYRRKK